MRAGLVLIALAGCGGSSKPQPVAPPPQPAPAPAPAPAPPPAPEVSYQAVCHRMMELKAQKCGEFVELELDEPSCVNALTENEDNPNVEALEECVPQPSCEEVVNCLTAFAQQPRKPKRPKKLRACNETGSRAVGVSAAEFAKRNGANVTRFSDAKSTKEQPIEMCTVPEENAWLESLACDDGSHPVTNAETVRSGNVGPGGRCGAIIDRYVPKCGSTSYEIFIDAYVCPKP